MDTGIDRRESYISKEKLQRISQHLASIDPVLVPFATQLVLPPYKDLSNPEIFARHTEQLQPTDLVAVHLTDAFPADGIIHPTVYYNPAVLRFSIHLTINSVAEDVEFHGAKWSWKDRRYAVLIPFGKIMPRIDVYNPGDTIVMDDLELPEGTIILKDTGSPEALPPAGQAQVVQTDYSQAGEQLNGFHRAVYEQIIKIGYFPQLSNIYTGWYSGGWNGYRNIHAEFCRRYGLTMGTGHRGHWSKGIESFSRYLEGIFRENSEPEEKEAQFRSAVQEAQDNFLSGGNKHNPFYIPGIPEKYKQTLVQLLKRYGQQFPEVEIPDS
ncbi:hypothetical protein HYU93_02095 [Candidatus Daviesbacteria bacterium]|nr:hypothetical protein [Candidatus Daviesbacteria bacterium]